MPGMDDKNDTQDEIEPIPPEQARAILEQAIRERLGEYWDDEEEGWFVVARHDYMARLTRGSRNIDFYVDLLGQVTVEEKPLGPEQASGRLVAWMLLGLSLVIALLIARIAGMV